MSQTLAAMSQQPCDCDCHTDAERCSSRGCCDDSHRDILSPEGLRVPELTTECTTCSGFGWFEGIGPCHIYCGDCSEGKGENEDGSGRVLKQGAELILGAEEALGRLGDFAYYYWPETDPEQPHHYALMWLYEMVDSESSFDDKDRTVALQQALAAALEHDLSS